MKTKENSTCIYNVDQLLKLFLDKNGHILVDENCPPKLIEYFHKNKTINNMFKLVKSDRTCPHCGSKLHIHSTVEFELDNSILILKTVYKCSNEKCNCTVRPKWENDIDPNCNYSNDLLNKSLQLGLICNVSFEKQSEIIELFTGVHIPRNKLFEHAKKNHEEFVAKENEIVENAIKKQKIKFSKVLDYDEQYVLTNDGWMYKLMALDPSSNYIYDFKIVNPVDFNLECVTDFLKPIVEENNIKVLSADGAKINKQVADELNLELALCGFHKMNNLMKIIRGSIRHSKRKKISMGNKIEDNLIEINKIKKLRQGQKGKIKKEDKKAKRLVEKKKKYERENSEYQSKIREYNEELKSLIDAKDAVSLCIGSKTYSGGINRYNRMMQNINKFHQKTHPFIINLGKSLDSLLMHTKHKDIPTTNNGIELCHKHTLNGYDKRKYKTIDGIKREMDLKRIRWNKRCVLEWV